jgi:hypothetical protein
LDSHKHFFELIHASDSLLKEWRKEILLGQGKLVLFCYFGDLALFLENTAVEPHDSDYVFWCVLVKFLDLLIAHICYSVLEQH